VGRKARQAPKEEVGSSRHIPDAIKRAVYERDEGSLAAEARPEGRIRPVAGTSAGGMQGAKRVDA